MPSTPVLAAAAAVEAIQLLAAALLVQRLRRRVHALTRAADLDDLTGLPGRRGLYQAHRTLRAAGASPGILLLDLSLFKDVNDTFGHDAGDQVLRQIAARLATVATRSGGLAGRLGGDEFVLLLPDATVPDRLVEAAGHVHQALTDPIRVADVPEPVTVTCVIGLAAPGTPREPDRPFRAADVALYHARHHRQPFALYQPGMTYPAAAHRHGPRLRDRRPAPPIAVVDTPLFARLSAGQVSTDVAHPDDIADLQQVLEVLDPAGRDFGTDVADLVARCADHHVLRYHAPVTAISIQPTTLGDTRDGGFLVLVHLGDAVTLASTQIHPRAFHHKPARAAVDVLTTIAETACQLYNAYRATATAALPRGRR